MNTKTKELGTLKDFLTYGLNKADSSDKKNFGSDCKYIANDNSFCSGTDFASKKEAIEFWRLRKTDILSNKNKTEFAILQLGHACFGVAPTIKGVKSVAKKWTDNETHSEINELSQQFSTKNKLDGDLVLLECSKKYANLVRKNGGDISYNIIDGCVYADCDGAEKSAHSYSITYANKKVKDLKSKIETAKKLWS